LLEHDRHMEGRHGSLVLLHSMALDRAVWDDLVPYVADRFDVIAVDLPGHGASPGHEEMTIESMADAVAETIRALEAGPALVAGLSLGGCVAQALALHHPELVRGLALIDTTCWYGEQAAQNWAERARKGKEVGMAALVDFQVARWFTNEFIQQSPSVTERVGDVWAKMDVDQFAATCKAMGDVDLRDQIGQIAVPTTIIVGAEDRATDITHAKAMKERIPGATLHVIESCAHLSPVERPEDVAGILTGDLFTRL
jgi:3-oxoadipate enol-lactonase